uniref:Uncharacterized protein n=1 Tax=Oryza glumipatula TaxID=40148 RepID=A0A0E0ANV1_9ORYZ
MTKQALLMWSIKEAIPFTMVNSGSQGYINDQVLVVGASSVSPPSSFQIKREVLVLLWFAMSYAGLSKTALPPLLATGGGTLACRAHT